MSANAQRGGRPAEYRWRPLFNAAVWLCSNAAKTRNPLKLPGCPKLTKRSQLLVGRSLPYRKDMWGRYGSMVDIQSAAAEVTRGIRKR